MGAREILYTLGGLLALLVVGDTLRRIFLHRTRKLRVRLEPVPFVPGKDEPVNAELLGPARVVVRDSSEPELVVDKVASAVNVANIKVSGKVAVVADDLSPEVFGSEGAVRHVDDLSVAIDALVEVPAEIPLLEPEPEAQEKRFAGEQQDLFAIDEPLVPPPRRQKSRGAGFVQQDVPVDKKEVAEVRHEKVRQRHEPSDVIVVHVLPAAAPFQGEDLLRAVLSYGLRFGDMSIFHRHEQPTGRGDILFSMANAVEPGTFNLDAMPDDDCYGVTFFLGLPGPNSIHAFDVMMDTARRLAQELGGAMLDQQRIPMTPQLAEHYRERVQEFERRRLMGRNAVST